MFTKFNIIVVLPGNGFSTEQDETGYRETKEIGEKGHQGTKWDLIVVRFFRSGKK